MGIQHNAQEGELIDQLSSTHVMTVTCALACVVHNPTDGVHRKLPLHWRDDRGIFERICKHGIGHPDPDQFPYWEATDQEGQRVHGCSVSCRNGCGVT